MEQQSVARKSGLFKKLMYFVALPAALGVLGGYGLHRQQASQIREDFSPYRTTESVALEGEQRQRAYSYIATPTEVNFGAVENYRRYQVEWEIVNSGRKALDVELVSSSCEVIFDGAPIGSQHQVPGQFTKKIAMSWVVDNSEPNFNHELVLKTNDDNVERRTLRFHVYGTVDQVIDVQPAVLDFGALTSGQTKELTAHILCYSTKNLKIDDFSFSNEALRGAFDVKLTPVEDRKSLGGNRVPSAAVEIVVTAKADSLEKKSYQEMLLLKSNLPQTEGLKIRLKVNSQ